MQGRSSTLAYASPAGYADRMPKKKTAKKPAAESPVSVLVRKLGFYGTVKDLAAWLDVNQATIHRWRNVETFNKATGIAPTLIRRLAPADVSYGDRYALGQAFREGGTVGVLAKMIEGIQRHENKGRKGGTKK